ncbi:MAG: hypothetical protein AAF799_04410 [Myxococcota bacterium]
MSHWTRVQVPFLSLLTLSAAACPVAPGAEDTQTPSSATESADGSTSSAAVDDATESTTAPTHADDTSGGTDLGPPAECVSIDRLSFDDLIDGVASGAIRVDDQALEVEEVAPTDIDGMLAIAVIMGDRVLLVPIDAASEEPTGAVLWLEGETLFEGQTDGISFDEELGSVSVDPMIVQQSDGSETRTLSACFFFGAGTSRFAIDGSTATLEGTLGSVTYRQVDAIIEQRPEVDTLVMQDVPGSINDEVNVQTGRLIREAGWGTFVPADGQIASGGVDLFCAGFERSIEPGAMLGVHSWSDGVMDGADYPQDHPAHESQLAYFIEMLGDPLGPDFYWFTLAAAPAEDIHWMTDDEIATHQLLTE